MACFALMNFICSFKGIIIKYPSRGQLWDIVRCSRTNQPPLFRWTSKSTYFGYCVDYLSVTKKRSPSKWNFEWRWMSVTVYARCMSFSMLTLKVEAHQGSPQCLHHKVHYEFCLTEYMFKATCRSWNMGPFSMFIHSKKLWWEVQPGLNAHTLSCWQSSALVSVHPTPTTASFTHHCISKPVCLNYI